MHINIKVLGDNYNWENHKTYNKAVLNQDVGLDVPLPESVSVPPNTTSYKIKLGIKTEPTHGYMLLPRSSIIKTTLRLSNSVGIIDKSYRGELMAVVDNIGNNEVTLEKGCYYFQIVAFDGNLPEYSLVKTISDTFRSIGGFGSTTN